jgi:6-phosphogluconate dehydrogenase (decarboxylating)
MDANMTRRPLRAGHGCVACYARFSSRGHAELSDKLLSALRGEFGGHREPPPIAS